MRACVYVWALGVSDTRPYWSLWEQSAADRRHLSPQKEPSQPPSQLSSDVLPLRGGHCFAKHNALVLCAREEKVRRASTPVARSIGRRRKALPVQTRCKGAPRNALTWAARSLLLPNNDCSFRRRKRGRWQFFIARQKEAEEAKGEPRLCAYEGYSISLLQFL